MSSDVWQARIDLCVDKKSRAYWIMLRLRSQEGEEKKHMSVLIPKDALSEAIERASRMEEKGLKERSGESADLPEDQDD